MIPTYCPINNYFPTHTNNPDSENRYSGRVQCHLFILPLGPSHIRIRPQQLILYVEIKCQLDPTEVFIADLIACSICFGHHFAHHQELKSIIQWLLPVVFRAVVLQLLV